MKDNRLIYLIVFLIALVICGANIWGYPITILDESKNAEAAREMWLNNSFVPTFNGVLRTDKPPLHYFFMQLSYSLFGTTVFGARIFGAVLGAGFITYLFEFLKRFSTLNVSYIAPFILLSSFFFIQEFHLAVPDPYLIAFLCSAWMVFYTYYKTNAQSYLWLFYILVGLATLAKGPVAIGLSGLIVLVFLIAKKEFSFHKIKRYHPIPGGIIVLIICVPWFWWIHSHTNGAYTEGFFIKHNIQRFSNEMEGHGGIFLITWLFVLLGLFPFGMFIPQGLWHGYKFRKKDDLKLYSFIISIVVIVFFSISSTKLPNYTLIAMPFLAILVAGFFDEITIYKSLKNWMNATSLVFISLVTLAIPAAVFVLFKHSLIFQYQLPFTLVFLIIGIVGLVFIWKSYVMGNVQRLIMRVGFTWIIIGTLIFYVIYPKLTMIEPVRMAHPVVQDEKIVVYKNYDPAFNFNYKRIFPKLENSRDLIEFINAHPNHLVLSKDKVIMKDSLILNRFDIIFKQPSVFENYKTVLLRLKD